MFAQTRLPDEVIVVDDCSADDTLAVVETVARSAPVAVRSIRLDANSGGPARPLNVGIRAAIGDVISPLDHDDQLFPDKIDTHAQLLAARPDLALVFGDVEVMGDGRACAEASIRREVLVQRLLKGSTAFGPDSFEISSDAAYNALVWFTSIAMTCSNLTFRKSAWESVGGFDERHRSVCDWQLFHSICRTHPIAYLRRPTCRWFASATNLTQASEATGLRDAEIYKVWSEMDRTRLHPDNLRALRTHLAGHTRAAAWVHRNRGEYGMAARLYVESLMHRQLNWEAAFGLAKLIPHKVANTVAQYVRK